MKKLFVVFSLCCIILFMQGKALAEPKTVSWSPVTRYTNNTIIVAPALPVTYDIFWATTIPGLVSAPHTIVINTQTTSAVFDIVTQGMVRGSTIYVSGRAKTALGEVSANSPEYSWMVSNLVLSSLAITSGPSSINEETTGTFVASATWNDNSVTIVTPIWSVSPITYASISSGGVLSSVGVITADQTVTVTASYTNAGITRTANRVVTIVNSANIVPPSGFSIQ